MQAKISNKTTLDFKTMLKVNFKNDQILSITYSLIFIFMLVIIYNTIKLKPEGYELRVLLDIALTLIAAFGGFLYPIFRAINWKRKTIKKYGTDIQSLEYQFTDINMRVINHTSKAETKLDYRNITKVAKIKSGLILNFGAKIFIYIANDGFTSSSDLNKLHGYLHRFINYKK